MRAVGGEPLHLRDHDPALLDTNDAVLAEPLQQPAEMLRRDGDEAGQLPALQRQQQPHFLAASVGTRERCQSPQNPFQPLARGLGAQIRHVMELAEDLAAVHPVDVPGQIRMLRQQRQKGVLRQPAHGARGQRHRARGVRPPDQDEGRSQKPARAPQPQNLLAPARIDPHELRQAVLDEEDLVRLAALLHEHGPGRIQLRRRQKREPRCGNAFVPRTVGPASIIYTSNIDGHARMVTPTHVNVINETSKL